MGAPPSSGQQQQQQQDPSSPRDGRDQPQPTADGQEPEGGDERTDPRDGTGRPDGGDTEPPTRDDDVNAWWASLPAEVREALAGGNLERIPARYRRLIERYTLWLQKNRARSDDAPR